MERKRGLIGLATLVMATLVVTLGLAPRPAFAVGEVAQIGESKYATLGEALKAASTDGAETKIQLIDDATIDSPAILSRGTNITLDLAGHTVTANKAIQVRGTLTIKDSTGQGGAIVGSVTGLLQLSGSSAVFSLEGGIIETTAANAVSVGVAGARFSMTGGVLKAPDGSTALNLSNGTAAIAGGTVCGDVALKNDAPSAPTLTVGVPGDYETPVIKGNIVANLAGATVNLAGGTIGGVTGALPEGTALTSHFASDISNALPDNGVQCVQQGDQWVVVELTAENAGAKIVHADGTAEYYATAVKAFAKLADGDALTLYRDASAQLTVADNITATIDLNGHTLSSDAASVVHLMGSNTNLTISNGSIVSTSIDKDATIVMMANAPAMTNTELTLRNVDLKMQSSGGAGIQVYGLNTKNAVTLDGCTLTVPDDVMGIYFPPADSTLTINDTTITAGTGIGLKGGTLSIGGATQIHARGANDPEGIPSSGGIAETGAAIYVDGGYVDREVAVNVTGGTFVSEQGSAIQELVNPDRPADTPVSVAVTGGSFSDASMRPYLAGDAAVVACEDGTYDVYPTESEALANGGSYKVVDGRNHLWLFSGSAAAEDFAEEAGSKVERIQHTVTFDDCWENTDNAAVTVAHNEPVARPTEDPTADGWKFLGWYEAADGQYAAEPYDFETPVTADLTLYAKWERVSDGSGQQPEPEPEPERRPEQTESAAEKTDGLAKTSDVTFAAPLVASAVTGMVALGVAGALRRRNG